MSSMGIGGEIDNTTAQLRAIIEALAQEEQRLMKLGCLEAHIHYKSRRAGGHKNITYMYEPVDSEGRRQYHHVGTDKEAQAVAIAKVKREAERAALAGKRGRIERELREYLRQLESLSRGFARLLDAALPKEESRLEITL